MDELLAMLDLTVDDEYAARARLDVEVAGLAGSGVRFVVLDLGTRTEVRDATCAAIALAHQRLAHVGGRLAVVGSTPALRDCSRCHPELFVTATVREALSSFGIAGPAHDPAAAPHDPDALHRGQPAR